MVPEIQEGKNDTGAIDETKGRGKKEEASGEV